METQSWTRVPKEPKGPGLVLTHHDPVFRGVVVPNTRTPLLYPVNASRVLSGSRTRTGRLLKTVPLPLGYKDMVEVPGFEPGS